MQENNFERDVRQKLDELHLTPSEPVWQNIEASIKKKRERRLVLWMLPLLMLTGGLAWWLLTTPQHENTNSQQATERVEQAPTFSKPHTVETDKKPERKTASSAQQTQMNPKSAITSSNDKIQKMGTEIRPANRKQDAFKNRIASNNVPAQITQPENSSPVAINPIDDTKVIAGSLAIISGRIVFVDMQRAFVWNGVEASVIPDAKSNIVIAAKDSLKTGGPSVQIQRATWKWHITGRVGASNITERLFSLSAEKSSGAEVSFDNGSSGGFLGRNSVSGNPLSSSTKGAQFSVGAGVKKAIGKRTSFVTGLQYGFYRNYMTVTPQLPADSAARFLSNQFLFSSAQNTPTYTKIVSRFTNIFHFIELPVGFEHQLLKKQPLHLQYGVTVSQFVSGKALSYNSNTNVYYQDASTVRKTGFNIFMGATYTVWKRKGLSLQAGPQLQYGMRNLFKNEAGKNHLVAGGIAATMAF